MEAEETAGQDGATRCRTARRERTRTRASRRRGEGGAEAVEATWRGHRSSIGSKVAAAGRGEQQYCFQHAPLLHVDSRFSTSATKTHSFQAHRFRLMRRKRNRMCMSLFCAMTMYWSYLQMQRLKYWIFSFSNVMCPIVSKCNHSNTEYFSNVMYPIVFKCNHRVCRFWVLIYVKESEAFIPMRWCCM
jgi:hypothetical protein